MATGLDTRLEVTSDALSTIHNMRLRCEEIGNAYGESSEEYKKGVTSLLDSLIAMIGLGGRITKDDDIGLYGVSFIHYGVVFHRKRPSAQESVAGEWSVHS